MPFGVKVVIGVSVLLIVMSLVMMGSCFAQPSGQDDGPPVPEAHLTSPMTTMTSVS
jgi:uncharacterized lipoprotein YajG